MLDNSSLSQKFIKISERTALNTNKFWEQTTSGDKEFQSQTERWKEEYYNI